MPFQSPRPLPPQVADLLGRLQASPRLIAHLTLVHDVASDLVAAIDQQWPGLDYDREAVRMGAALHDIDKVVHRSELTGPGHEHETTGEQLLWDAGTSERWTRFARTHARWSDDREPMLEDLLVAAADSWWRGQRGERLESALCDHIAKHVEESEWQVYTALDDIAVGLTADADARLAWQNQHAP